MSDNSEPVISDTIWELDLPIYNYIRRRIETVKISEFLKKPEKAVEKETKFVMALKIGYLFAAEPGEFIGQSNKPPTPISGNHFSQESIGDEEALVLSIQTNRTGARHRKIAVPLNPTHEPWSKEILEYTEKLGEEKIWDWSYNALNEKVRKMFLREMPTAMYRGKQDKEINSRLITLKSLREARLLELGLCHNFNEYNFKHYCGDVSSPNYEEYFNRLLNRSDFYNRLDVDELLNLKNIIFNPQGGDKYNYKDYLRVVKKINRKYVSFVESSPIFIDDQVDVSRITSKQSGEKEHKRLMINAENELLKINSTEKVEFETANLDVIATLVSNSIEEIEKKKIVVECGDSYIHKLLEAFNDVYSEVKKVDEFWVLNYPNEETHLAKCFKFLKEDSYR